MNEEIGLINIYFIRLLKAVTGEQANVSEEKTGFFWFYICIFLRFSVDLLLQGDRVRSYACNDICSYPKVT